MGLVKVHLRSTQNILDIAPTLNAFLPEENASKLGQLTLKQSEAFKSIKEAVTSASILSLPKVGPTYSRNTEVCHNQVGCALIQVSPTRTENQLDIGRARSISTSEITMSRRKSESPSFGHFALYAPILWECISPYRRMALR